MLKSIRGVALVVALLALTVSSANATTVSQLLTDWRSDIGEEDSTNSRFTNAQGRRLLTRATNAVSTIIGGIESQSKIRLDSAKTDYTLSGYWGIDAVMYKVDKNYIYLSRVLMEDLGTKKYSAYEQEAAKPEGATEDAAAIERYAIFKDTLAIYPTGGFLHDDTLYVRGFVAPASLDSNSQTTQLKIWTDEFVVEAAVFYANKRDLTLADETAWWQSFYNRVLTAQAQYVRKSNQVQPTGAVPQ